MADTLSSAEQVAREINRVLAADPNAAAAIADKPQLQQILQNIQTLDQGFEQRGGVFFSTGSNAFETADKFTQIHIDQYRETGRPSLPALAVHHAEQLGLDKNSAEYKAMILVSVRAEMQAATSPEYHSKNHYMDVAAMSANLLEKNNEMVKAGDAAGTPLSKKDQALTFISAIGHDLDHDGKGNPPTDHYFNERKSFNTMKPLLEDAGLSAQDIGKVETILNTTSPNGPHAVMKGMAQAQREGKDPDFSKIDPDNKFPELHRLAKDPHLTQMAAIVSDSDLYASSGAGLKASEVQSALLTTEVQKSGVNMDLRTDGSRKFFLDHIVGQDGYASNAGREVANDSLEHLRQLTEARLAAAAKEKADAEKKAEKPEAQQPPAQQSAPTETPPQQAPPSGAENVKVEKPDAPDVPDVKTPEGGKVSKFLSETGKKGGVVPGVVMGTLAAGVSLVEGSTPAEASQVAFSTAVPYGEAALDVAKGDIEGAKKATVVETASTAGGMGGAFLGGLAGQAMIPIPGVGFAVGAVIGGVGGGFGGGALAEKLYDMNTDDVGKYLQDNKISSQKEVAALQNDLLRNAHSALPEKVALNGKEVSIETALHESPDKIKTAMKDSPDALKAIEKWEKLEEYKQKLPAEAPAAPLQVAQKATSPKAASPS